MFRNIRDSILNIIFSRMFTLLLVILVCFFVLIQRLFTLQIVKGETYQDNFTLKIMKEKTITSTRGKIFDCKGKLLAYDELAYSVTIEDNYDSTPDKNQQINDTIQELIKIVEGHGNKLLNDFNVVIDGNGNFQYNVTDKALLRFLADVYGHARTDDLLVKEKNSTPNNLIMYLAGEKKFGIGKYEVVNGKEVFRAGEGYTNQELLKIVTIRYAMNTNSFQKYIATTVATGVNEETVAVVMENKDRLQGVDIAEDTIRKYIDDDSMSPILGYTGKVSTEELETLNADGSKYEMNDMVGKAGVEQVMEKKLQGTKGSEKIYVDNLGKVVDTAERIEPIAGNDLYLTIDSDLQSAIYHIIEQKLAGILISKIRNIKEYTMGENDSAANIEIPIDDVYFALFNNNVIDISHIEDPDAKQYEKAIHEAYQRKLKAVREALMLELNETGTPYTALTKEMQVYESYVISMLSSPSCGVLLTDAIDQKDETYLKWKEESISLKEFLNYAISQKWIDITKIKTNSQYSDSDEIYHCLLSYINGTLATNNGFSKKIYKYMIHDNNISGQQICMVLYEQRIIDDDSGERAQLESGGISSYTFILDKIRNLEITPAQLALDPCSGSSVITNVKTGEVLACVSYPSYNNNMLANTIDADYYNTLTNDLSNPLYSYATQQKMAPGSTFKMVSATAGIEEGVIGLTDVIECNGVFDRFTPGPKCWIYPSRHGNLNVSEGIENSCNCFFYEVGYRLGTDVTGKYDSELGLGKIAHYADLYGLTDLSGIELTEAEPQVSTEDAVRSAIGQGTHSYTTVGLARYVTTVANDGVCYNLSLLDKLEDPNGNILENYSPSVRNHIDLASSYWDAIHSGMRGVVENAKAFEGFPILAAGKTGTAQQIKSRPNHALFVGFAPYDSPEIAIATRIAYGYTSANSAEVSRDILSYYFGVEAPEDIINGKAKTPDSGIIGD